jgi:hypothetical protein
MSLYDKLSPEALKVLDQEMVNYPTLTKGVIDSLKNNDVVIDLTIGQGISIGAAFGFECTATNLFSFFE